MFSVDLGSMQWRTDGKLHVPRLPKPQRAHTVDIRQLLTENRINMQIVAMNISFPKYSILTKFT